MYIGGRMKYPFKRVQGQDTIISSHTTHGPKLTFSREMSMSESAQVLYTVFCRCVEQMHMHTCTLVCTCRYARVGARTNSCGMSLYTWCWNLFRYTMLCRTNMRNITFGVCTCTCLLHFWHTQSICIDAQCGEQKYTYIYIWHARHVPFGFSTCATTRDSTQNERHEIHENKFWFFWYLAVQKQIRSIQFNSIRINSIQFNSIQFISNKFVRKLYCEILRTEILVFGDFWRVYILWSLLWLFRHIQACTMSRRCARTYAHAHL